MPKVSEESETERAWMCSSSSGFWQGAAASIHPLVPHPAFHRVGRVRPRSEVAREAIAEYLEQREKERLMAEMVEEVRRAYADPEIRREALEIAEEGMGDFLDAITADERAAGIDPNEKWWR